MTHRIKLLPILFSVLLVLFRGAIVSAQDGGGMQSAAAAPQLALHLVDNFFKYPSTYVMGEVIGVATNAKGHIFLLNRGYHPLLEFNADGTFVRSMGEGSATMPRSRVSWRRNGRRSPARAFPWCRP